MCFNPYFILLRQTVLLVKIVEKTRNTFAMNNPHINCACLLVRLTFGLMDWFIRQSPHAKSKYKKSIMC